MNNPYVRFFIILTVTLFLGFGIGYVVKPSGVRPGPRRRCNFYPIVFSGSPLAG